MDFDSVYGKRVGFHGVDCNVFCVSLDGELLRFEAVEDPSDGYRSYLGETRFLSPEEGASLTFFREPVAELTIVNDEDIDGYRLVDEAGHAWLRVGTDHSDDWYPWFVFDYDPPRADQ